MNHRHSLLGLFAPLLLIVACSKNDAPTAAAPAAPAASVAIVNGKALSKSEFDMYVDNVGRQSNQRIAPEQRPQLLDQFISMKLAAEAAEKDGVTKDPKVADQLELARLNVLVDAGLQKYLNTHPVKDEELKPEYDAQVAAMPREYHARHILVGDKALAESITKDLKGGADFAKLAKQKSTDSSSKDGGLLDWLTLDNMVKPFADAVVALQPGQITEQPVKSEYGWHIIKLEESRAPAPPAFDEVKDRVRMFVQRKKLQTYLDELRKGAQIEKKI
jgi:peptidyl-prolyl cis-trans isomerase C